MSERETALRLDATYLSPSGRIVRVQGHRLTGRIIVDSRGRVAVRNIDTDRLSYVHEADLREVASPLSASPQEPTVAAQLIADDVEWVVNDNAELGVKIGRQFFFCYKGHSLVYDTGTHDDGTPMMWRPVFKREFGECIHPVNYANPTHIGTVSLADSDQWKPLPISPQEPTGASPQAEELRAANVANLREMVGMAGRHRETLLAVDPPPSGASLKRRDPAASNPLNQVFTILRDLDMPEDVRITLAMDCAEQAILNESVVSLATGYAPDGRPLVNCVNHPQGDHEWACLACLGEPPDDSAPSGASPQATGGYIHHSLTDWIPTPGCDCDRCTSARKSAPKPTGGASSQAETVAKLLLAARQVASFARAWEPLSPGDIRDLTKAIEAMDALPAPVSPVEPTPANYDDPKTWASGVLNTGQSRVEPTGASPQAETSEDEDDVPAVDSWSAPLRKPVVPKILSTDDFYALLRILEVLPVADPFLTGLQAKLSDEERRQHGNRASHLSGPEFVREIERIEALIQSRLPAPVSPVEPTPEPEPRMAFCDACVTAAHCNHHWRCLAECTPSDLKVKTNPCVWRITTGPLGTWVKPSCVEGSIPAPWGTERAKSCHLCGSPLRLVPAEEK